MVWMAALESLSPVLSLPLSLAAAAADLANVSCTCECATSRLMRVSQSACTTVAGDRAATGWTGQDDTHTTNETRLLRDRRHIQVRLPHLISSVSDLTCCVGACLQLQSTAPVENRLGLRSASECKRATITRLAKLTLHLYRITACVCTLFFRRRDVADCGCVWASSSSSPRPTRTPRHLCMPVAHVLPLIRCRCASCDESRARLPAALPALSHLCALPGVDPLAGAGPRTPGCASDGGEQGEDVRR